MQLIKNNFTGGLNLDDSPYAVQSNSYVDALNISKNAVEGANDLMVTNVVGNRLVNYTYHAGGIPTTIGAKENTLRNTVIELAFHPTGYHAIIEYNHTTGIRSKIFENLTDSGGIDVLGFLVNKKITSINIYPRDIEGDLLLFIDSLGRPTILNIELFRAGVYTPVTRQILDFAKNPPLSPPTGLVYDFETGRRANSLRKRFFRFAYRYVYKDFQKSTLSPISEIPIPLNILDDAYTNVITNNNVIRLNVLAGAKDVIKTEVLMSYVETSNDWSGFSIVGTIDAAGDPEGTVIPFSFRNDGVYSPIDPNEQVQLYDFAPRKANCMELANGNVPVFGGITEGYNKDLIPNVTLTVGTYASGGSLPTGSLDGVQTILDDNNVTQVFSLTFSGVPITGTVVTLKMKRGTLIFTAATYTTLAGNTAASVANGLNASLNAIAQAGSATGGGSSVTGNTLAIIGNNAFNQKRVFESLTIVAPATTTGSNSVSTFSFSQAGKIALVYFDEDGRTNGVLYNEQFITPAYAENVSQQLLLPFLNAKIFHVPPIWAKSYQWLMTKDNTNYIYWYTVNVDTTEAEYIYFNVNSFSLTQKRFPTTSKVLNYSFKDGDRIRIIKRDSDNLVFNDTFDAAIEGLVVDPKINGAAPSLGQFIKIKKTSPISGIDFSSNLFVIQIYSPSQQQAIGEDKNQTYFEISREYRIANAGLPARSHLGEVTNQNIGGGIPAEFNFYKGDAYFRPRKIALSEAGIAVFSVLDKNIVDTYISAVNNIDGRPNLIDENARESYFPTLVRFGQAYQANTNLNGFNRLYSNNFDEYDLSFGDIMRLKTRDRFIRVFQKFKIGSVPVFNKIGKDPNGDNITIVTDKLLNPIQYNLGDYGIGEHAESLASYNFSDSFTTNIKGVICRVSNDGVTPISVLYKVNSFASSKLPLRTGDYKVYGAYDQVLNNYIIALEATGSDPSYTLIFNEEKNRFDSFVSYKPEMMVTLGTLLISFKNGQLWKHDNPVYNNFYGVQYNSEIEPVFNEMGASVKSFMAIEEHSNNVWVAPEIKTSLMSFGTTPQQSNLIAQDFTNVEGKWCAGLLRDSNSIGGINGGSQLKGDWIKIKLRNTNSSNLVSLNIVSLRVIDSPLNNK